jgi:hypothetical protein
VGRARRDAGRLSAFARGDAAFARRDAAFARPSPTDMTEEHKVANARDVVSPSAAVPAPSPPTLVTATANNSNKARKLDVQASYQTLIAGLLAHYAASDVFELSGQKYTRDELVAKFKRRVDASETVKAADNAYHATIQAERQVDLEVRPLRQQLHKQLDSKLGSYNPQLRDYGFAPKKPQIVPPQVKAEAAAKAIETRKARHIMGKKQRAAIKAAPVTAPVPPPAAPPAGHNGTSGS